MIRGGLIFLLLLVVGFGVLYVVTGGDSLAQPHNAPGIRREHGSQRPPGVVVPTGGDSKGRFGDALEVGLSGAMTLHQLREVRLPDGRQREVRAYTLQAADSKTMPDGAQQLDGVDVLFYDTRPEVVARSPEPVRIGRLQAKRAFVELGVDKRGRRSVATDKDIELLDAELQTTERARVKNLHMEIARALVRITERAVSVRTPEPDQAFAIEIADRGHITLGGHGLRGRFPIGAAAKGDDTEAEPVPMTVHVASDPVLEQRGEHGTTRLRAAGPLDYVEDVHTGQAHVTTSQNIVVEASAALPGQRAEPFIATGDAIEATLLRAKSSGGTGGVDASWRSLHLTGTPARLVGSGMDLTGTALDATPNLHGTPYVFTASGSPKLVVPDRAMTLSAEDRIHLIGLQEYWQPLIGGWGFVPAAFSSQVRYLLVFRGASAVTLPRDGDRLTLRADRGLRVLTGDPGRGEDGDHEPAMTVAGIGRVAVDTTGGRDPMAVRGNKGFLLEVGPHGTAMRLGPAESDPSHAFDVAVGELGVSGTGACRVHQPLPGGTTAVDLRSPAEDLVLSIPGGGGSLSRVGRLRATVVADGLRDFEATGTHCSLTWQDHDEKVTGQATRIRATDPRTIHLEGAPAEVTSRRGGRLSGRAIVIGRLSEQQSVVTARDDASLRLEQVPGSEKAQPLDLDLHADRITVLPFLMPAEVLAEHLAVLPPVWSRGRYPLRLASQHLIATGSVRVENHDQAGRVSGSARGDRLVLRLAEGDVVGRLLGAPAHVERQDDSGQTIVGEAADVVIERLEAGERLVLRPAADRLPLVRVPDRSGPLARFGTEGGTTTVRCHSAIEVEPAAIVFPAAVTVRSHLADGRLDRSGFQLDAASMRMARNADTGAVERVHATGGADLRWSGMRARARDLALDLLRNTCVATDHEGTVRIEPPGGSPWVCKRVEFNYRTFEATLWSFLAGAKEVDDGR